MVIRDPPGGRRRAFSLMELMVVNVLMGLLIVLIAGAWRSFGPMCVEVIARSRVATEANLAAYALHCDMSPPLPATFGAIQPLGASRFQLTYSGQDPVTYTFVPPSDASATPLQSNYADGHLTRQAGTDGPTITVARHVEAMAAYTDSSGTFNLTISFFYRGSRGQYTFQVPNQP
jgi:hypothetical protein